MPASHSQTAYRTGEDFCKNPLITNPKQNLHNGHKYKFDEAPRKERERVHGPGVSLSLVSETPSNCKPYSAFKVMPIAVSPPQRQKTPTLQPTGEMLESTSTNSVSLVGPDEVKLSGSWEDRL